MKSRKADLRVQSCGAVRDPADPPARRPIVVAEAIASAVHQLDLVVHPPPRCLVRDSALVATGNVLIHVHRLAARRQGNRVDEPYLKLHAPVQLQAEVSTDSLTVLVVEAITGDNS